MGDTTQISRTTILAGKNEINGDALREEETRNSGRIRAPGAGRKSLEENNPGLTKALERLIDPVTRGDPESPLRWTCKRSAVPAGAKAGASWLRN